MRVFLIALYTFSITTIIGIIFILFYSSLPIISPLARHAIKEKPLLAYTFDNLRKTKFPVSNITLGRLINNYPNALSQMFYFSVPEKPNSKIMKKVSGIINVPKTNGIYPIIIMLRGYVPPEIYKSGIGTQPVASVLAEKGFITLAPDFIGFGESDHSSKNGFEDRFQTYTTTLTLLNSLKTLNAGFSASYSGITGDTGKIGIWGHSNGGHIALASLAITSASYPTVLWAPVSKSFPYSILYYTDESDDQGKAIRKALASFEESYNTDLFSPPNFYKLIKAPLEVDQGANDREVPYWWSDDLVAILKKDNIDVTYNIYANSDHNLFPDGWSNAVQNTINFYNAHFNIQQ